VLLESTGNCCTDGVDESSIRRVDPRTGTVLSLRTLPEPIFGEGIAVVGSTAWMLTWQDGVVYRYSPDTLRRMGSVPYPREGWGLTTHGRLLVASDGSARLRWLVPGTLRVARSVVVRDGPRAVSRLNELEMLNGRIWANVWMDDRIAVIHPRSGRVTAWLDMAPLRQRIARGGGALNGIARDPVTRQVVVTGKNWDRMFVIRPSAPIP
jgi:glutaminyl-peptide cyclotransferase